jgi:hypothetical protein
MEVIACILVSSNDSHEISQTNGPQNSVGSSRITHKQRHGKTWSIKAVSKTLNSKEVVFVCFQDIQQVPTKADGRLDDVIAAQPATALQDDGAAAM